MAGKAISWLVKAYYTAAWFGIFVGIIGFTTLGYWRVAPYNGLTEVTSPFPVKQEAVYKGQLVTYTMSYCVEQDVPLPITVHRAIELQNADNTAPVGSLPIAPPLEYEITERCESRDFFIGIPMYVPVGTYHVHTTTHLQVNPVREVTQSWYSENFKILQAGPAGSGHPVTDESPAPAPVPQIDELMILQRTTPVRPSSKTPPAHIK